TQEAATAPMNSCVMGAPYPAHFARSGVFPLLLLFILLDATMPASAQLASALFALGSVGCWGVSDFLGGHTAKRFNSFFLAGLGHLAGTILVASLALSHHEVLPPWSHLQWAMAAGAAGGVGLALFYRALAQGNMGIAAPVSAVLGAAIPTAF